MKNVSAITMILMSSLFIYSCVTSETQALDASDILGKWTLKEATRGGKPTSTLESIYFEFKENGQAKSNFNLEGQDQELTYELKEGNIVIKGASNLNIEASKDLDGHLVFNTSLKDYAFVLTLEPAKAEEEKVEEKEEVEGHSESDGHNH